MLGSRSAPPGPAARSLRYFRLGFFFFFFVRLILFDCFLLLLFCFLMRIYKNYCGEERRAAIVLVVVGDRLWEARCGGETESLHENKEVTQKINVHEMLFSPLIEV